MATSSQEADRQQTSETADSPAPPESDVITEETVSTERPVTPHGENEKSLYEQEESKEKVEDQSNK